MIKWMAITSVPSVFNNDRIEEKMKLTLFLFLSWLKSW